MRNIKRAFWGILILLSALWLLTKPAILPATGFFVLRDAMMQYSGIIAMGCMSVAMILSLRLRWPERWLGGLDKMYRLHKWMGIAALVVSIVHWLWSEAPKWGWV